ncbi:hypothetical protein DZB84_05575 [Bacillus sp. HNG]|uniref:hypothetical protein n=1 Tax=Bacillus sp. HNG TaxID=2293325 RepID=UPI000E2ED0DC|nr:hypothetical protein [Bacillus sp. HNG]RFB18379.1 hypothetical protein DZB84_05575 [Bacillus sp. HNG]
MREKGKVKELFAAMSTAEKAKYIWEYYRYYLFAFLLIVAVTVFLVSNHSQKKEPALSIFVLGDLVDSNEINKIAQKLNEEILSDEERKTHEVSIQVIPYAPDAADFNIVMAALQKVSAEISTGDLDVLFIDKKQFEMMNHDQYFYSQNELVDNTLPVDEEFLYFDNKNQITGIDSSAVPLFKEAIDDSDMVMGVLVNSQKIEKTKKLFKVLFMN